MKIYLAGPIDHVSEKAADTWRRHLANHLILMGIDVYNPFSEQNLHPLSVIECRNRNNKALSECDILIMDCVNSVRRDGTISEIIQFMRLNRRIYTVGEHTPDYILGGYKEWVRLPDLGSFVDHMRIMLRPFGIMKPDMIKHAIKARTDNMIFEDLTGMGRILKFAYDGDAGIDLPIHLNYDEIVLSPDSTNDLHTHFRVNIPYGHYGRIIGRSSTIRNYGLHVNEGIIDNGYRGELFISVTNKSNNPVHIGHGVSLAQLILAPLCRPQLIKGDVQSDTVRGTKGFGSSGV